MDALLGGGLTPAERKRFDADVLAGPLGSRMDVAVKRGAARRREFLTAVKPYLAGVDPRVKLDLPVARRLAFHLVENRTIDELAESDALQKLVTAAAEPSRRIRKNLRWYADLPLRDEIPESLYRLRAADLIPVTQVEDVSWEGGRLRITGHAYLAGLSVRSRRFNRATVVLRGPRWLPPIRLRTRRIHHPEATHGAREAGCNYDWSGFTAELSPGALRWRAAVRAVVRGGKRLLRRRATVRDTTTWRAEIVIWSRGARAVGLLRGPSSGRTERPPGVETRPRWWIRPVWTSDRALQIVLQPTRAELTGVRLDGERLELKVLLPGKEVVKGHARLDGHRIAADFTPVEDGTEVVVPLAVASLLSERDGGRLWIEPKGDPAAPVMLGGAQESRSVIGEREITVLGDRRDRVIVSAHRVRPVVSAVTWGEDGSLTLEGSYPGSGRAELTIRHRSGLVYATELERDGSRFTVRLAPAAMPRFGETVPLGSGNWSMAVREASGKIVPVRMDHAALAGLDEGVKVVNGREYRLISTRFDVPVLAVAENLPDDEKGAGGLYALQRTFYPAERTRELSDATVYVAYDGRQYEGNVRAIYEERVRRGDDREHIWIVKDGAFTPPGSRELGFADIRPTVVRAGSREHYAVLARSRYVVTNGFLPPWFRAREDQTVVQTWHGSPLKRMGNDLPHMSRDPRPPAWHRQAVEVRGWDLLVAQSPWAVPVLRKAFGYQGEVLESGYPRNDVLVSPDREGLAARVRARLGVAADARLVLYAPTFRDYDRRNASLKLDLAEAHRVLGPGHEFLIRGHSMQATPNIPQGLGRDVTTYPDMADLLLVADVLITDYSSVMFDFAATGRPMLFFTYDLQRYSAKRGLYLDLTAEAPGPLLSTGAEVIEALRTIDQVAAAHADRYERFRRTYAPRDDGKATARLVDHVF
ncbi:CDP-glycerol glycerophosphotransferase family protein [Planomonospora sp. ID67723]|uniref:CDP-glycerol glycerophosphotransferase family protein n=1 Tax=Planomonospora sp. ID67723 TaxID=2738134 RepID=UPI0018C41605|nr:CDP-glycerol glycerophosphotransferase family protein [Planomonospora sp. ID67723]MBG0833404.1 CDP-glycerol glycerophosphotransferase family protein [Planomonospora sp. ID67723]